MSWCFHVPWCTSLFLKFGLLIEIFLKLTVNFYFWNILKFGHNLINTFWYFSSIWKFRVGKSWIQKWSVELQTFHSSFLCSIFSTDFWQGLLFFLKAVVSLNQQKCKKNLFGLPKNSAAFILDKNHKESDQFSASRLWNRSADRAYGACRQIWP